MPTFYGLRPGSEVHRYPPNQRNGGAMATRAPGDRLLLTPARRAILRSLEDPGDRSDGHGRTAAQVAADLGLHVTTARFHLEQLVEAGLVTTALRRGSVGRPRKVYLDARGGPA